MAISNAMLGEPGKTSEKRYIYAIYIPAGTGIDLQPTQSESAGLANSRLFEILTLDVPFENILGFRILSSNTKNGKAIATIFQSFNRIKSKTIPGSDLAVFDQFKSKPTFDIIAV